MTEPTDKNNRAIALTGLLFAKSQLRSTDGQRKLTDAPQVLGPRPSEAEVWNWMHEDVSEQRAMEIRSHLAFDSELYETWRQMRLTKTENINEHSSTETDDSAQRIRKPHPVKRLQAVFATGIALAATVAIVAILKPMLAPTPAIDFWQTWQTPKTNTMRALSNDEIASLRYTLGVMKNRLASQNILANGPNELPLPEANCYGNAPCLTNQRILAEIGNAVTSIRIMCVQQSFPANDAVNNIANSVSEAITVSELALIQAPLQQLADTLANNESSAVCSINDRIIERLLLASQS